jgi:Apea-like HEPN
MDKQNRSRFDSALVRLRQLIQQISTDHQPDALPFFQKGVRTYIIQHPEYGSLVLVGEHGDNYFQSVLDLYNAANAKSEHISFNLVESATQVAILKALNVVNKQPTEEFLNRLDAALTELKENLSKQPIIWSVQLEVTGLYGGGLPRTVGDTEFYVMDQHKMSVLQSQAATILHWTGVPELSADRFRKPLSEQVVPELLGKIFANARIPASDPDAAKALGFNRLRLTADVTNFFARILGLSDTQVGLPWDAQFHHVHSLTLAENARHVMLSHSFHGPFAPLDLAVIAERADHIGFARASALLAKTNLNSIESRLLSALRWAGRGWVEDRREEAFLLFVVALESLLLDNQNKEQLRYRFAVRGAHLLGTSLEENKKLSKQLKSFYDLRSAIVHSGSVEVSDSDRDTVRFVASRAIYKVLATKPFADMTAEEELDNWFESEILGPNNSVTPPPKK